MRKKRSPLLRNLFVPPPLPSPPLVNTQQQTLKHKKRTLNSVVRKCDRNNEREILIFSKCSTFFSDHYCNELSGGSRCQKIGNLMESASDLTQINLALLHQKLTKKMGQKILAIKLDKK